MSLRLSTKILVLIALLVAVGSVRALGQNTAYQYPYENPNLPISERVDDLVGRMTLQEKVSQMDTSAPAIPRLGIPEYDWWSESLHGFAYGGVLGRDTVFPEPIGLASTWDIPLESQLGAVISDEDRAEYNLTGGSGHPQTFHGLTYFAPNINIFRDPRWGRGQETYGEDPYLTANFGVAFIRAMQGYDPRYLKVIATPKHFAVHSGPELLRHQFDAEPSAYDLYDTYLPAFQAAIELGHAHSIMGAYSALYGIPDCASPLLLQTNLRQKWGFDGYVVSDCGAITDIYASHHYAKDAPEAAADAVLAGCDLACDNTFNSLPEAVQRGLITEAQIDVSVKRLFTARMELGMFDPPAMVPYTSLGASVLDSDAHRVLARRAADESIVLLKNNGMLPLSSSIHSIAVIGPNAADKAVLRGNYNGQSSHEVTILEGIQTRAKQAGITVTYAMGTGLVTPFGLDTVPSSALQSDGAVGLKGEYFDNENLSGPPVASRTDPQIAFDWSTNGPGLGMSRYGYSVRWTGTLTAPTSGSYVIGARGDDGFRIFLGGQDIVDDWRPHAAETRSATVTLTAGQQVPITLEYFQDQGGAEITLLWNQPGDTESTDAVNVAKQADAVVFVGGISSALEGEEGTNGNGDRISIDLPQVQQTLLSELYATGKPVILVLLNGSALSVNWAQSNLPAIVEAWYPGEEGGDAVADVLFGDYNPAGRLPVTFYTGLDQLPSFTDYNMKDRTYRYFDGTPLYPFGYGLSYTTFVYSKLSVPSKVKLGQGATVSATVKNTGSRSGDEIVELYLRPAPASSSRMIDPSQPMPRFILAGFQRIHLDAGQSTSVKLDLKPQQLLLVDSKGARDMQPGTWEVYVGGRQPDLSGETDAVLSARLTVAN